MRVPKTITVTLDAYKIVTKNIKNFEIDIFLHKGSYFCKSCNKIVLKSIVVIKTF